MRLTLAGTAGSPASADPWLAKDKAEHLLLSAAAVVAVYACLLVCAVPVSRSGSLVAAALTSLLLGSLKELGDHLQWWHGNLSYRDFTADIAGIGLAAAAILAYNHSALQRPPGTAGSWWWQAATGRQQQQPYAAVSTGDIEMGISTPAAARAINSSNGRVPSQQQLRSDS